MLQQSAGYKRFNLPYSPFGLHRFEVVMAIVEAAKKNFESVSIDLLNIVKERTLDKNVSFVRRSILLDF